MATMGPDKIDDWIVYDPAIPEGQDRETIELLKEFDEDKHIYFGFDKGDENTSNGDPNSDHKWYMAYIDNENAEFLWKSKSWTWPKKNYSAENALAGNEDADMDGMAKRIIVVLWAPNPNSITPEWRKKHFNADQGVPQSNQMGQKVDLEDVGLTEKLTNLIKPLIREKLKRKQNGKKNLRN